MGEINEIQYGDGFLRDLRHLPREVGEKFSFLLGLLQENVFNSRLHTKQLRTPLKDKYSFRITRDWRVGFMFSGKNRVLLLVADH